MSILLNGLPTAYRKMEKLSYLTVLLGVFVISRALVSAEEGVNPLLSRENRDTIDISPGQCFETIEKLKQQESHINANIEEVKKLLIEKTNIDKEAARQKFMQDKLRLGWRELVSPYSFETTEIIGYAFRELAQRIRETATEREEIESQMKVLLEKRPSNSSTTRRKRSQPSPWSLNGTEVTFSIPEAVPGSYTPQEYYIAHEILQLKLNVLKKEEANLLLKKKKLENEKYPLDLEKKRIFNEDVSKFNSNPVLNERYLLLTFLGKGAFAEVYKAFDLKERRYVACKVHQPGPDATWGDHGASYINNTLREYNIQRVLNHPRIVKLYDAFEIDANTFCTVLEYCGGGDLEHYLAQRGKIPENEAKLIVMQMVSALKYLNEITPPVIHFDLKPDNILLMDGRFPSDIKIADFGSSKIVNAENSDQRYLSPNVSGNAGNPHPSISSTIDVLSVGFIFYRCLYGTWPVMAENLNGVDFPDTPTVSEEAKSLMRSCLKFEEKEKINVLTLAQHQYLQPPVLDYTVVRRTRSKYNKRNTIEKKFEENGTRIGISKFIRKNIERN